MANKKILIVDDSALVRKQVGELIERYLDFDISFAKNGQEAVDMACSEDYDVITMDINMPVLDGISAVKIIMEKNPTAILMLSSLTTESADITIEALELGAIDYVAKPGTMNIGKRENSEDIITKIKSLSRIPKRRLARKSHASTRGVHQRAPRRETVVVKEDTRDSRDITKVVLIGSSTGGPGLIEQICASLPIDYPYPVCIVQHMPEQFTAPFTERLNRASRLEVHESKHNMEVLPGHIYIAKGGVDMNFSKRASGKIVIRENSMPNGNFFQPSVDEMMKSALTVFDAKNLIAVILTGIGDDGADAMVKLKASGAYTIGESEETATVYGMPKEAYERGGVSEQLPFHKIVKTLATLK